MILPGPIYCTKAKIRGRKMHIPTINQHNTLPRHTCAFRHKHNQKKSGCEKPHPENSINKQTILLKRTVRTSYKPAVSNPPLTRRKTKLWPPELLTIQFRLNKGTVIQQIYNHRNGTAFLIKYLGNRRIPFNEQFAVLVPEKNLILFTQPA